MKILSIKEACTKLGVSRTTLWQLGRDGKFPVAIPLTTKRKGYLESEVDQWIADRVAARDTAST